MNNNKKINNNVFPKENNDHAINYFSALADKFSKAAHILYIALIVCFIFTLIFNSKILTYNNFNYLFKDMNAAAEIAASNYNSISYSNDNLRTTKEFRGGIITVSTTDMAIYNATGKKTLNINYNFVQPVIATSQKYAVIYDQGGNSYSVYNSFARVHHGKTSHPISFVTVADNGWYALVTKDNEHTSVVHLYDDDFNLRNTYSFASKYVFSVSINAQGNRIAIVSTEAKVSGDGFITSVMICDPGKDSSRAELILGDEIPFGATFTKGEMLNIACSDALYVLNENNGNIENKFEFDFNNPKILSLGQAGCAIAYGDSVGAMDNTVLVFNERGNLIYETKINGSISDIEYIKGYVFINLNGIISKIDIKNNKVTTVDSYEKGTDIIVYDSNNILLCCQAKAKYINF